MKEFNVALDAVLKAGTVIRKYFNKVDYKLKSRANPVTVADIKSQEIILKSIEKNFKNDSVIAEENDEFVIKNEKRIWFVDPLDGTVNYAHGFPHFAVSVGFVENDEIKFGIIYDPVKNEMFSAIKNKGAYLNNKKIKVSDVSDIENSLLATGFAYDRKERAEYYCSFYSAFLKKSHDIRRAGAASLDMAWLACGRIDGYWEFNLKPWDVCAGKLIVEEAGGEITDFKGKLWKYGVENYKSWGKEVLCSNSKIHMGMLGVIRKLI